MSSDESYGFSEIDNLNLSWHGVLVVPAFFILIIMIEVYYDLKLFIDTSIFDKINIILFIFYIPASAFIITAIEKKQLHNKKEAAYIKLMEEKRTLEEEFKIILEKNPVTSQEYIDLFLSTYGDNYPKYLNQFKRLLYLSKKITLDKIEETIKRYEETKNIDCNLHSTLVGYKEENIVHSNEKSIVKDEIFENCNSENEVADNYEKDKFKEEDKEENIVHSNEKSIVKDEIFDNCNSENKVADNYEKDKFKEEDKESSNTNKVGEMSETKNISIEESDIINKEKSTVEDKKSETYTNQKNKERYIARKLARELFDKGCSLLNEGKSEEAIEYYNRTTLIRPNYTKAWYYKGLSYLDMGNSEEAIKCFEKVKDIDYNLYSSLIENKEDILLHIGCSLSNEEKYWRAIGYYDRAISIRPDYAEAWYNKGEAYRNMGRPQEAINCYEKIKDIDYNLYSSLVRNKEGMSEKRIGGYYEEIETVGNKEKDAPKQRDTPRNLFDIGCRLLDQGKNLEAIEYYNGALSVNPYYAEAWDYKGLAFFKMDRYQEAIKCFDVAILVEPRYVEAWDYKGLAFFKMDRYQEAIKCFDVAISIMPKDVEAWYYKGLSSFKIGIYEEAIRCYEVAKNIDSVLYFALERGQKQPAKIQNFSKFSKGY